MVVPIEMCVRKQVFIVLFKSVAQYTPNMCIIITILLQTMNHLPRLLSTYAAKVFLFIFNSICLSKLKSPEAFESELKGK